MAVERRRLIVTGTVQGVGFRPFVHRLAAALELAGTVHNDTGAVVIEAEGPADRIDELVTRLRGDAPVLARVEQVQAQPIGVRGDAGFHIAGSASGGTAQPVIGPDAATCDACVAELFDPGERRYRYPFLSCTDCGPRYSVAVSLPYDRATTTMAGFPMCDACRREYEDPADRRFHAQTVACRDCGPQPRLVAPDGSTVAKGDDAVAAAVERVVAGGALAVKGLGGYHFAVDATSADAVNELRRRKRRPDKPFAVMLASLDEAARVCRLSHEAITALTSPARPIVLAPRRHGGIAEAVAPGLAELGVMLPYTPLHHLLLRDAGRPLVMTSGNHADEPIVCGDDDAITRLGPMVDGVLVHDRAIATRCDDSVVRGRQTVRRSRGVAPAPVRLPVPARRSVLAVGAHLKSTVAFARDRRVTVSHHLGDLAHVRAYMAFVDAVTRIEGMCGGGADVVAHDLHPEYLSTKFATDDGRPVHPVQHHHAHVASCLVDNEQADAVLGVAFDGFGLGADGTLWGGEFLVADLERSRRVGHLLPVAVPGGEAAVREPWRMAVSWLAESLGDEAAEAWGAGVDGRAPAVAALVRARATVTSSAGRLFDAVAALLGGRPRVTYEGQAAIELEALARRARGPLPRLDEINVLDGEVPQLDPRPLVGSLAHGGPAPELAAAFHRDLGTAVASMASELAARHGVGAVALTGGVFQNTLLTEVVSTALAGTGLDVLVHRGIPCNDGGISVGQAAVAAASA